MPTTGWAAALSAAQMPAHFSAPCAAVAYPLLLLLLRQASREREAELQRESVNRSAVAELLVTHLAANSPPTAREQALEVLAGVLECVCQSAATCSVLQRTMACVAIIPHAAATSAQEYALPAIIHTRRRPARQEHWCLAWPGMMRGQLGWRVAEWACALASEQNSCRF